MFFLLYLIYYFPVYLFVSVKLQGGSPVCLPVGIFDNQYNGKY